MFDKVFLDLEDTVITNWRDQYYTNVQKVRTWLIENEIKEVGIFSFAIYDDADKTIFEKQLKVGLTDVFGIRITTWPSVLEMMDIDTRHTGDYWRNESSIGTAVTEFINLRGKTQAFINFANEQFPDAKSIALLDDVVKNTIITYPDEQRTIHLVNVDKLPGLPAYQVPKLPYA
jgi:hypothetical protein